MREVYEAGGFVGCTADTVFGSGLTEQVSGTNTEWNGLRSEFQEIESDLNKRYQGLAGRLPYPREFAFSDESSFALYALARIFQPSSIVETGVANGHSTFILLNALIANGSGELHSFDVSSDVGILVDNVRAPWNPVVLEKGDLHHSFRRALEGVSRVDLFLHDSVHAYRWQMYEFETVAPMVEDVNGLILSDDVDKSVAFLDFCVLRRIQPFVLLDGWRMLGATRVQAFSTESRP